ncbi:MAG: formylglycine-generating enzyme family protein [Planctomycetia bacterium]|nr:formylglycine-generating enzyme family protein [Planctomycetia bacterium]
MPDDPLAFLAGNPADDPQPAHGARRQRRAGVEQLFEALEQRAPDQAKLLTNSLGMKLVLVPPGTFMMGSGEDDPQRRLNETPRHEVALTQGLYFSMHPVTQEQYRRVMGANPSRFLPEVGGGPEHPVEHVSWHDAVEFCRRLSALPQEQQGNRRYRLPTEAEWEYACRAGTSTAFCFGPQLPDNHANFDAGGDPISPSARGKTSTVGAFPANHFGLHDLHGNLWEWCADWYDGNYYRNSPRLDPPGPATGRFRVVRGGSWRNRAGTCRAAYRNALVPNNRDPYTGFRVVVPASGTR